MKLNDLKSKVYDYACGMLDQWFDREPFIGSLGKTILKANLNKYDDYFQYVTDENGDVLFDELVNNMKTIIPREGYQIDIKKLAFENGVSPFISKMLPNKVLLFTRNDLDELIRLLSK